MTKIAVLITSVLSVILVAGLGLVPGLNELTLPGGPDLGDNPKHITVASKDVLNLAHHATVKVDDVTVGVVEEIRRKGWEAEIVLLVRRDVEVPANAVAEIRQTGLLGEKYVDLAAPLDNKATGVMADGATIPINRSSRGMEVEEVLGALSLLLNGGGIERIQTISQELHQALDGREDEFRALLRNLDAFTAGLDENHDAILTAIDGLESFTGRLRDGNTTIAAALDGIPPALKVLADQRTQLVGMLKATSRMADAGTETITATRADLVADLEALEPTLTELAESEDSLPQALEFALTFPFPDGLEQAMKGDYVNIDLDLNVAIPTLATNLTGGQAPPLDPAAGIPGLDIDGLLNGTGLALPDLNDLLAPPQLEPAPSGTAHPSGLLGGQLPLIGGRQ